ncbi:MAG: hypothetical protein HY362_04680 [Candidatus Aenigmarchaeota archaeon]|nr:hypothetical protein [Candidatus Aenigmarchaeota archaeon]
MGRLQIVDFVPGQTPVNSADPLKLPRYMRLKDVPIELADKALVGGVVYRNNGDVFYADKNGNGFRVPQDVFVVGMSRGYEWWKDTPDRPAS